MRPWRVIAINTIWGSQEVPIIRSVLQPRPLGSRNADSVRLSYKEFLSSWHEYSVQLWFHGIPQKILCKRVYDRLGYWFEMRFVELSVLEVAHFHDTLHRNAIFLCPPYSTQDRSQTANTWVQRLLVWVHIRLYVYIMIWYTMCAYVCVYIYIYIYMHKHKNHFCEDH